jgi:hypothetical protein
VDKCAESGAKRKGSTFDALFFDKLLGEIAFNHKFIVRGDAGNCSKAAIFRKSPAEIAGISSFYS